MRSPTASPKSLRRPRNGVVAAVALVCLVYVAGYLAAALIVPTDSLAARILIDLVYMIPGAFAIPLAAAAAWRRPMHRRFWLWMTASLAAGFAGDVSWAVYDLVLGQAPTPSIGDLFYLANVALLVPTALAALPSPLRRVRGLVDLLVPLGAVAYAVYQFVIGPQLAAGVNGATVSTVAQSGLAVIAALVFTALLSGHRAVPASVKLVYAAVVVEAVSDPVWSYLVAVRGWQSPTWIYTAWQVTGTLAILAAVVALRRDEPVARRITDNGNVSAWLVTGGLAVVLGVIALRSPGRHLTPDAPYVALGAIALVVARLHQVARQRGRIAADLRRSIAAQERLATTDALTHIANRQTLDGRLADATEAARAANGTVGLATFDLDHFTRLNDGYGHPAGDEILREVAIRLRRAVRPGDTVARMAGEEFAVLAPDTTTAELVELAERCRAAVGGDPFEVDGSTVSLTVSAGAACFPLDAQDADGLAQVADRALYEAKRLGRNRLHVGSTSRVRVLPMPQNTVLSFLEGLADQLDREQAEQEHSMAMLELAARLCDALELSSAQRRRCLIAARLHDVGKVGIPHHILTKPGPLTLGEMSVMREHVRIGVDLLERCAETRDVAPIVGEHHERNDGRGYPQGKAGDEISVEARVITAVDAWTAMLADRPYRAALSREQARIQLVAGRGSQFDERVVDALLALVDGDTARRRAA